MDSQNQTVNTRSLDDFILRMRRGTVFYVLTWLIPAVWFEFYAIYPFFFIATSIFCLATTLFRVYVCKLVDNNTSLKKVRKLKNLAIAAVSTSALLWGWIYAFIIAHDELKNSLLGLTIITGIVVTSATALLSIYKLASILNQVFVLVPAIVVMAYQTIFVNSFNPSQVFLISTLSVAFLYLRQICNTAHNDYISATKNQILAETRAEKMEYLSIRDPLTKLKNRLFFDRHLEQAWISSQQNNSPISLMLIDLDHFKKINDTYGHLLGDECLRTVAASLRKNLREDGDHLARFGGEEFVLCLEKTTPNRALLVAERLLQCVSNTEIYLSDGRKIKLSCSIGLASFNSSKGKTVDNLLAKADEALYKAKENGRNQISINSSKVVPLKTNSSY